MTTEQEYKYQIQCLQARISQLQQEVGWLRKSDRKPTKRQLAQRRRQRRRDRNMDVNQPGRNTSRRNASTRRSSRRRVDNAPVVEDQQELLF